MAVTAHWYGQAFRSLLHKEANIEADALKVMLTTSSYAYNQATDRYQSTVTNEVSGTGYVAGGAALAGVSVTDAALVWALAASNTSWAAASFTAAIAVVYDSTPGSGATDPLISLVDFGGSQTVTGATFTIAWNASGVCEVTVS